MAFTIPAQVERDILSGKAVYRSFQTGIGGQTVLIAPSNSYFILFGYEFSPAGNGLVYHEVFPAGTIKHIPTDRIGFFGTQQVSFYTGEDFFPFVHNVPILENSFRKGSDDTIAWSIDAKPITRQVYIPANKFITATVGLCELVSPDYTQAVPTTGYTPQFMTYGASGQIINFTTFTDNLSLNQFVQPTLQERDAFFTPGPAFLNVQNQLWWAPDTVNGMYDPTAFLRANWFDTSTPSEKLASAHYKLTLHLALYNQNSSNL